MPAASDPIGLDLLDHLTALQSPTIDDYCAAAAEYVRRATEIGSNRSKATQIRLSAALSHVTLTDFRKRGLTLARAVAAERTVGGGLRSVKADVSEITETDGLRLAVEIKPVHLAVGRAIWNRFGDIRTFAVNLHLKFPFAVVGGILTLPTSERVISGDDDRWKPTTHLLERAIGRLARAGGRKTEGDAEHLLEAIAVVVFDRETGLIAPDLPPVDSGLRWDEFVSAIADAYEARFDDG